LAADFFDTAASRIYTGEYTVRLKPEIESRLNELAA